MDSFIIDAQTQETHFPQFASEQMKQITIKASIHPVP